MGQWRKQALPWFAGLGMGLFGMCIYPHDLITAEYAERYMAAIAQYSLTMRSTDPADKRAEAAFQLGRTMDEIREFLNRDMASHGQVQGLASNRLVAELKTRGTPLAQDASGRFLANTHCYLDALKLAPNGPREGDALFKLLQGHFYDSFEEDPLASKNQSWTQLAQQIELGERFIRRFPRHREMEEAQFILLIRYVQAARSAPSGTVSRGFSEKARAAITDFEKRYPESMRAAALPTIRAGLENK